ncbi:MAG: 23S rRNA (pseudouridine(1915)-N(3))-methyltransferase RlmH [Acidiferrobacterales bacterium]
MQIHIIAVGHRMPEWVKEAYSEYTKRMPGSCRLRLHQIPARKRTKGTDIKRLLSDEGARILAAVPDGCRIIALERSGQPIDTDQLVARLQSWLHEGQDIALLIGGPEGLAESCLADAHEQWSLSRLTLAHPLVRVLLAEQFYRAWSIIDRRPYHR